MKRVEKKLLNKLWNFSVIIINVYYNSFYEWHVSLQHSRVLTAWQFVSAEQKINFKIVTISIFCWKINFKEHFSTQLEASLTVWDDCYLRRTIIFKGLFYKTNFPFSAHPFWFVVSRACYRQINLIKSFAPSTPSKGKMNRKKTGSEFPWNGFYLSTVLRRTWYSNRMVLDCALV